MTREEFAKLANAKYDKINALKKKPTLLDYEQGFVEIWQELGRQVIQADLGDPGRANAYYFEKPCPEPYLTT